MKLVVPALLLASLAWSSGSLKVQPGQIAPRFLLVKLDNDSKRQALRDFADSARRAADSTWGKPVVLSFWSTTCVNCRAEMPRIQAWANGRDVAYLPLLVENIDPAAGMQWLQKVGVSSPGLHDRYQVVGKNYGVCEGSVCTVPALVAIRPDGRVALTRSGYDPQEPLEALLDSTLGIPKMVEDSSRTSSHGKTGG
ncbi:MAG: TlpA family protein disulfide reductase [Fibrobacteria bacterium]|nr:TlpA family protein disulfide reductase [Fibrobacteria bacterium]